VRLPPGLGRGWDGSEEPRGGAELLKRFLLRADVDARVADCLKEIGLILNLDALEGRMPAAMIAVLRRFNGKPVLTRPQHRFHRDPANRYLAVDLDLHRYQLVTRGTLASFI